MTAVIPNWLHDADTINVVALAGPIQKTNLQSGIGLLQNHFAVSFDESIFQTHGYLAGTDATRIAAMQNAIDHPFSKAILSARGGYGTTRIIDRLNFRALLDRPKWIVGSSDVTALLIHLWCQYKIVSIHGPMVSRFKHTNKTDVDALIDLLKGEKWHMDTQLTPLCPGCARGPMIGGNLFILSHLMGTLPPMFAQGAILFLEEIGEHPYRIDRCLVQLKRSGVLDSIAGVVLGDFTNCDPLRDGVTALEVLTDFLAPLGIPAARGYPAAHGGRNTPFLHGATINLTVDDKRAELEYLHR